MAHPVGIKARILANKSATVRSVNNTTRMMAATIPTDVNPCVNRSNSWKFADFLGLYVKICSRRELITKNDIQ